MTETHDKRTETHACDLISRAEAIDALGEEPPVWYDGEDEIAERNQWRRDVAAIKALPSEQFMLYGYSTDTLALVAAIMAKEGITPEDAVTIFKDVNRMGELIVDEMKEIVQKTLERMLKEGGIN